MRVLHVCSEIYPLLKTGGLADVAGALPPALVRAGCDARLLVPGFPAMMNGVANLHLIAELPPRFGASALRLLAGTLADSGLPAYVIDAPGLYDRPGNPYYGPDNHDYSDNHRRFGLLGWMAAELALGRDPSWNADIIHGHDWHAGLAPAYLKAAEMRNGRKVAGSVFTVHNLAYQGVFPSHVFGELELPWEFFNMYGVEFYGNLSFLKAGLFYSDKITTVSPTYAREIQEPEQGCGLDGLLRGRAHDLRGILNGVDLDVWNPAADPDIASHYDRESLEGKRACKRALQQEAGLAVQENAPLFGVVSRLTDQKGLNLVQAGLRGILSRGGQLVLLGSGDPALEAAFREAAAAHPSSVSVHIGYDEKKSHRIIAGSDVILVPSRFEPCGLTQLYGLRYGTLPLVRRVGGLADSVVDCTAENMAQGKATGFVFDRFENEAFVAAVHRACALYARRDEWLRIQQCAMAQQFSWDLAAGQMQELYRQVAPR
ncbi:glycogen synthase GlgA [Noviherbaspirillum sp.]|mgnify:CR=1 FL=1|uniref:glycogen synthase GlgA n=1 Tax=Noviherbaspirillum sp. TaxID=1926288 RepID=UPI002FE224B0